MSFLAIKFGNEIMGLVIKLASWSALSPLMNMEVSTECPQVVTSYYSGTTQTWLGWAPIGLCVAGGIVMFIVMCLEGFKDDSCNTEPAIYVCGCGYGTCVAVYLCATIAYAIFMMRFNWSWIFGLNLNYHLRWPRFVFAYNLYLFHICMLVIWIADTVEISIVTVFNLWKWATGEEDDGDGPGFSI